MLICRQRLVLECYLVIAKEMKGSNKMSSFSACTVVTFYFLHSCSIK